MVTGNEHDMFYKFIKMEPLIFHGTESDKIYEFIIDCHKRLHKMGMAERYSVELVTFQFQRDART